MFLGSIVNLILPLQSNFTIDQETLKKLTRLHFAAFTDGICLSNSMTELNHLSFSQRGEVIKTVAEELGSRLPLIVETSGVDLNTTLELSLQAQLLGADACLINPPIAYSSMQEVYTYFSQIVDNVAIPIILRDFHTLPLTPRSLSKIVKIGNIIGIVEENADLIRSKKIEKLLPEYIDMYTNDDASAMEFILYGGQGVISTAANIVPKVMFDMCGGALSDDRIAAEKRNLRLFPLYEILDTSNPIAVKWALKEMEILPSNTCFSKQSLTKKQKDVLKQTLKLIGVL